MDNDINYSLVAEWALNEQLDAAIAALIASIYPVDFGGRSFMHQRHHFRLLAHHGDELVAHVAVLVRSIRLDENLVDVLGLAEVATAKKYRRRGIASRLVGMAIDAGRESSAQFVVLFGTEQLYRDAGFTARQNPVTAVRLPGNTSGNAYSCGPQPLMICPVGNLSWDDEAPVDLVGHIF